MAAQKPLLQGRRFLNKGNYQENLQEQTNTFHYVKCPTIDKRSVVVRAYSTRVVNALKQMDDNQDISYYKGTPQRLVSVDRVKLSVHWLDFKLNPNSTYKKHIHSDRKTEVAEEPAYNEELEGQVVNNDGSSISCDDEDSEERNSNLPAVLEKRNRRPRVKVPCRQLSNYEWCVEWLFKMCNHPSTTLPLL